MTATALSEVSNGAKWNPDPSFNVAAAILADPEFASVLKVVLRDGHVMVPALKAKGNEAKIGIGNRTQSWRSGQIDRSNSPMESRDDAARSNRRGYRAPR